MRPLLLKVDSKCLPISTQGKYLQYTESVLNIATPLTALTGKDIPFKWGPKQLEAQEKLITMITNAPTLARLDLDKQFKLKTNASQVGTGAILYQWDPPITKPDSTQKPGPQRPVGFHSQKFTQTEQNYPIYDCEFLGVMRGLHCWSHLLKGTTIPVHIIWQHVDSIYVKSHVQFYLCLRESPHGPTE